MLINLSGTALYPGQPIVDQSQIPTNDFRLLITALFNRTGQGTGLSNKVANNLTATGSTQATSLALNQDWNEVLTVPVGSGVNLLPLLPGQSQTVYNGDGNPLKVYPAVGFAIDALGVNVAYTLAAGKTQVFSEWQASLVRSLQLG